MSLHIILQCLSHLERSSHSKAMPHKFLLSSESIFSEAKGTNNFTIGQFARSGGFEIQPQ